ncbi:MAG: cytochrome c oxidase accessory protein CcoG [Gammaproteobacteria bacterium]|nr:cytochrome c oxidase accessory protein CcoG [Gammaproteobacteria bacterium]
MNQLIPTTAIDQNDEPVVDATRHNAAVRLVKGKFQLLRRLTGTPLILLFLLAPWLTINGAPVLWMDLDHHVLHLFGLVFWPKDLLMLSWVAMASAFALFIAANLAGRIWCGFSCPQTVWSMMFTWVEEKTQGSRNKRLKQLDKPWYRRNWVPLILKHSIWLTLSFITGFTFVAYFETGQGLWQQITSVSLNHEVAFWLGFFSLLTYINAGWLREQVCLHMCPYARFQSVMVDKKTLKVSYDKTRGEPRKLKRALKLSNTQPAQNATKQGDCIDCQLCVQVCPVGIDIRQGLQYACIDCGACIDACDTIMQSIQKPKGLIKFSDEQPHESTHGFQWSEWSFAARPRLWGYFAAFVIASLLFTLQVAFKEPYSVHLSRDRGSLYFYEELNVSNAFTLSVQNKTQLDSPFSITITDPNLFVAHAPNLNVLAGQKISWTLTIACIHECPISGKRPFTLDVSSGDFKATLNGIFFAPR